MTGWFRFMLRHRVAVLAALALVTLASLGVTSQAVLSSSLQQMFFGESDEYDAYIEKVQQFGSDEFVLVGYADPTPLSVESLDRLQAAVDHLGVPRTGNRSERCLRFENEHLRTRVRERARSCKADNARTNNHGIHESVRHAGTSTRKPHP